MSDKVADAGRIRFLDTPRPIASPPRTFSRDIALFLDVDGTLLEIADRPDAVAPGAGLPELLRRLASALDGALALISGRVLVDIDRIFDPLRLPAGGQHGLERRDADGCLHTAEPAPALDDIRAALTDFADRHDGAMLEDKGTALALHYRLAPDAEEPARRLVDRLIAGRTDLHCLAGKKVFEIKPRDVDKGVAIARFMTEPPFAGRIPVFVGDDVTDEDGFVTVNGAGGVSIRVGVAAPSVAQYGLPDVGAVQAWLENVLETLNRNKP